MLREAISTQYTEGKILSKQSKLTGFSTKLIDNLFFAFAYNNQLKQQQEENQKLQLTKLQQHYQNPEISS